MAEPTPSAPGTRRLTRKAPATGEETVPGTRRITRAPEPTELVTMTHDRSAFAVAMGSIAVAVVAVIGVVLWVSRSNSQAYPEAPAEPVVIAAAPAVNVSIRDPLADASFTVGARISVLVTASSRQSPLSEVSLSLDGHVVGRRRVAPYGFLLDQLPLGVHHLTARAETDAGDVVESEQVTVHVVTPRGRPASLRTNSGSRMLAAVGVPWTVPVNIRPGDAPLTSVRLSEDGALLTEVTAAPWLLTWTPERAGARRLTVTAIDADQIQDAIPLDLLVYGNGGRILIGQRTVTEVTNTGEDQLDWLAGPSTRRELPEPLLAYQAIGSAKACADPSMPIIAWRSDMRKAVESSGAGNGFRITAPAGPGLRRLELLLGASGGRGALSVELDDASTAPLRDESLIDADSGWRLVTIDFRASIATRLRVEWTAIAGGRVRWATAVLRERGSP